MSGALGAAVAVRELGMVAAGLAVAGAFLLRDPRARALAVLLSLALTPVLLLGELWDSAQLDPVRERPLAAAGAALAGLAAAAALAAALLRRPALLALLTVLALPFRIPVETGAGDTANLLLPLYLVIAAGGLAYAWERLRAGAAAARAFRDRRPGAVELALLGALVLYAAQAAYSSDFEQALKNVVFFYVPFALLLKLLSGLDWSRRLVTAALGLATSLALVFVTVGFWEYAARELLWNPKVVASNQFESYFRVNSLFFDPNIYGRFLAIVMIGLAALLLWGRRSRVLAGTALVLGVLWGGLVLTFSQSSFTALLAGLAVLAALRFGPRPVVGTVGAVAVAAVALVLILPGVTRVDLGSERSLDAATSGRVTLMRGGVEMLADRPLRGFGSGSFAERFREREEVSSEQAASASHTIPITVAAEQGVLGLAAYLAVVGVALVALFRGLGGLRRPEPSGALVARAALAAGFAALVVHTQLYAAFLEDPLAWTLLGAAIGVSAASPAAAPSAPASARTRTRSSIP